MQIITTLRNITHRATSAITSECQMCAIFCTACTAQCWKLNPRPQTSMHHVMIYEASVVPVAQISNALILSLTNVIGFAFQHQRGMYHMFEWNLGAGKSWFLAALRNPSLTLIELPPFHAIIFWIKSQVDALFALHFILFATFLPLFN